MNENVYYSLLKEMQPDFIGIIDWFSYYLDEVFKETPENKIFLSEKLCSCILYLYCLAQYLPKTNFSYEISLDDMIVILYEYSKSKKEYNKDNYFIKKLIDEFSTEEFKNTSFYRNLDLRIDIRNDVIDFKFRNLNYDSSIPLKTAFENIYFGDINRLLRKVGRSPDLMSRITRFDLQHFLPYIRLIRLIYNNNIKENVEDIFFLTVIFPIFIEFIIKRIFQKFQDEEILSSTPFSFGKRFEKIQIWFRKKKPNPNVKENLKEFGEKIAQEIKRIRESRNPS